MVYEFPKTERKNELSGIAFSMDQVEAKPVRWLWPGLIPKGKLSIICGDPGLGKSFVTLDILARLSRGMPFPFSDSEGQAGHETEPQSGILLSAEDDPADTIRPRLEAMGADLTKAIVFDGVQNADGDVYDFVIGENVRQLYDVIRAKGDVGLVVVDPISAYVGQTDSYNNAQVRAMLKPLSDMASELGIAVMLVTHMRKSQGGKSLHNAMGSLAFTAAARVVLMVSRDPNDPETRVIVTVKSNLANDRKGYTYTVTDGKVEWTGVVEGSADEVMAGAATVRGNPVMRAAAEAIRQHLAEHKEASVEMIRSLAEKFGATYEQVSQKKFKDRNGFTTVGTGRSATWRLAAE